MILDLYCCILFSFYDLFIVEGRLRLHPLVFNFNYESKEFQKKKQNDDSKNSESLWTISPPPRIVVVWKPRLVWWLDISRPSHKRSNSRCINPLSTDWGNIVKSSSYGIKPSCQIVKVFIRYNKLVRPRFEHSTTESLCWITWAVVKHIGSNSIADVRVQQKKIRNFHWTLSVVIFTKMLRVPAFKDIKAWFICNGYCTYNGETRPASVRYVELKTCSLCISSLHVILKLANG